MSSIRRRCRSMLRHSPLPDHAEIMRSASRFQLNAAFQRAIVEPVQHALIFFRRNHLLGGDIDAASHGDQ